MRQLIAAPCIFFFALKLAGVAHAAFPETKRKRMGKTQKPEGVSAELTGLRLKFLFLSCGA